MPAVTLRIVTPADTAYRDVWNLREEVLRKPLGLSLLDEDLSAEVHETIIAAMEEDESVVGCLIMKPVDKAEVKLRQMAVATDRQGEGLGSLLLQKAEEIAADAGYTRIILHARETAVPFYEQAGYMAEGNMFTEVGIPHFFMSKGTPDAMS